MNSECQDNKSFYDALYNDDGEKKSFEVRSKTEAFKYLVKLYNINLGEKIILDLGFGSGNLLAENYQRGAICYGVEISQIAIDKLKNSGYFLSSIVDSKLPYQDEYFDLIVSSHTIEHINDEQMILSEIKRTLKRGGLFIMGVPTENAEVNALHFRTYSQNDVQRLVEILDASIIGYREFGGVFFRFFSRLNNFIIRSAINHKKSDCATDSFFSPLKMLRIFYHQLCVPILLWLYRLDYWLTQKNGKEIWYVFKKR